MSELRRDFRPKRPQCSRSGMVELGRGCREKDEVTPPGAGGPVVTPFLRHAERRRRRRSACACESSVNAYSCLYGARRAYTCTISRGACVRARVWHLLRAAPATSQWREPNAAAAGETVFRAFGLPVDHSRAVARVQQCLVCLADDGRDALPVDHIVDLRPGVSACIGFVCMCDVLPRLCFV